MSAQRISPRITDSAGGVVVNDHGQVLVVNQNHDSWSLPKGHIEVGEDPLTAAHREILEESGISELELVRQFPVYLRYKIGKDGRDDISEQKRIHMFLFRTQQAALAPTDPNNPEARWVAPDDVVALLTHPKDQEFFASIKDVLTQ